MSWLSQANRAVVRYMIWSDISQVMAIERASHEHAWNDEEFLKTLRQRNAIGVVAERDGDVAGFVVYELLDRRTRVLDLAVDPESRRLGVGRGLVEMLVSKTERQGRDRIVASVRETNLPAQMFFRAVGFRAVDVLREHYGDTGEDAYCMVYRPERSMR